MASRFLENLLSTPYPTVFGNALTMQEAQAANPAGAGSVDALRQQYEADQAALIDASNRLGAMQSSTRKSINQANIPPSMREYLGDRFLAWKGMNNSNQLEEAQRAQEEAQKAVDRSLSQYMMAQQSAASRPASQQQAVDWGQMAQAAENRMIGQAADAARTALANENARMATLAAHPLLGGGIR